VTEEKLGAIHKITFAWASSAAGAADKTTVQYYTGELVRVVQIPGTGGVLPTNGYAVLVNDDDGVDVLAGFGASLSNAAATDYSTGALGIALGVVANAQLILAVTGAGNAQEGQTILYIRAR